MRAVWIWYPGDFELYHGMLQNFQREERGYGWPAYWKMDDWRKNIRFFRTYRVNEPTSFVVYGRGVGHVKVNEKKYAFGQPVALKKGEHLIEVFIGNRTGLPCIYAEEIPAAEHAGIEHEAAVPGGAKDSPAGDRICSDSTWMADDFLESVPVGTSSLYTEKEQDPNELYYEEETVQPVSVQDAGGAGALCDFGRMLNGRPVVRFVEPARQADCKTSFVESAAKDDFMVCYGESDTEALAVENCYYKEEHASQDKKLRRRAFRYIFLPGIRPEEVAVSAVHTKIPMKVRASFRSDDEMLNRIWAVASETFQLCSGLFFIDGIKRDRWIWAGDAYQSDCVNRYLYFDREIGKRTSRALRGNTEIRQHINTIVDYSMLWLIGVENEYLMDGDAAYVREMYPKMQAMMRLLLSQTDGNGFVVGRERDWIYIDWADIDKEGPISAEQILLWKCLRTMAECARIPGVISGEALTAEKTAADYEMRAQVLKEKIDSYFWDAEKGAFIDGFTSGKRHVTRHANIFAVLFDFADEEQTAKILKNVLENETVPAITTPYFKFFELDAFGKLGRLDIVWQTIHSYWGGMLERGAVTFWELFDPSETGADQYAMYGDPFGKSLCHAWGASPIYLLGKYFLGVRPTAPGYETFEVKPRTEYFQELDCLVPAGEKTVHIVLENGKLSVDIRD